MTMPTAGCMTTRIPATKPNLMIIPMKKIRDEVRAVAVIEALHI
jgi:hypothetical protein